MITAQADRLHQSLTSQGQEYVQVDLPPAASARAIAVLYEDRFQLIIDPNKFALTNPENFDLSQLYGKVIGTPEAGGQRSSLDALSAYFGFADYAPLDLKLSRNNDPQPVLNRLDAFFRVRRLGNSEIQQFKAPPE